MEKFSQCVTFYVKEFLRLYNAASQCLADVSSFINSVIFSAIAYSFVESLTLLRSDSCKVTSVDISSRGVVSETANPREASFVGENYTTRSIFLQKQPPFF